MHSKFLMSTECQSFPFIPFVIIHSGCPWTPMNVMGRTQIAIGTHSCFWTSNAVDGQLQASKQASKQTKLDVGCELVGILRVGFLRSVAADCVCNYHRARRGLPRQANYITHVFTLWHWIVFGITTSSSEWSSIEVSCSIFAHLLGYSRYVRVRFMSSASMPHV